MATHIWRGDGVARAQLISRTIAGTWLADEEITLTLNGKDVTVTVGDDVTAANVATLIAQAWNGESLADSAALVSPLTGGGSIPEFREIVAQVSGAVLSLTARTAGVPFDSPTLATDSAGGDLGSWSTVTANSSPNDWATAENWDSDTVPETGDTVIIPEGAVSILYGLNQSAVTLASLTVDQAFGGQIGLPEINANGYDEYRDTYLRIGATSLTIGSGVGAGSQRVKINLGSAQATINISNSGTSEFSPAIQLLGTHASNVVNVTRGSVGIAYNPGEVSTVATLRIGYVGNQSSDSRVVAGSGVTLTNLEQSGGNVRLEAASTLITQSGGELTINGGAHAAINMDGGTCYYSSTGTLTTAKVGNRSTLDLSRDMRAKTITNCEIYASGAIRDPFQVATFTNGIDVVRTSIANVSLDLGSHFTLTPSAI